MKVHRLIGIILLLCCVSIARAQSINEVKEKQAKTEKEIAYLNKLLADARKDKSATVQKLNIINRKITKGKEMLRSLESEMQYFDDLITGNETIRRRLEADKQRMLDFYAKMVYETWKKRGSDNKLMYIFSASTFSQAYARYKYFEQIQDYSKKPLRRIQATNDSLRLINKHYYYAYSRSNLVNGLSAETQVEGWVPWWKPALYAIDGVLAGLTAAAIVLYVVETYVLPAVSKKKEGKAE